jgi:hypothetical protein
MKDKQSATNEQIAGGEKETVVSVPPGLRLVDVRVVAAKYNCDERTIYRWADVGIIPWGLKLRGLRKWNLDEVDAHIAGGCKPVRTVTKGMRDGA